MNDRDWDRELAKIDKTLASVSDDELATGSLRPGQPGSVPSSTQKPIAPAAPAPAATRGSRFGVVARLALAVALAVGMLFWPYAARCGVGLAVYLAAVGVVAAGGIWSAVWSWRLRFGSAHVLSLLVVVWGIVLGAQEILPRVGYARATIEHPAIWSCQ